MEVQQHTVKCKTQRDAPPADFTDDEPVAPGENRRKRNVRGNRGKLFPIAALLGALAALWSSGLAARSLSRPVGELREAALAMRKAPRS